jgi:hypothetical protein
MGKYDHIDFRPPENVAKAAEKGLEYRRRQGKDKAGLTPEEASKEGIGSGVQRAVNLKNRTNISPKVIKQMVAFFSRHEKNAKIDQKHKNEPWKDKGYVAWLIWGGDPGRTWAGKVLRQMEDADKKKDASDRYIKILRSGGVVSTTETTDPTMKGLESKGLAHRAGTSGGYHLWVGGVRLQDTRSVTHKGRLATRLKDHLTARLDHLLNSLQGWRTGALKGDLKIVLVGSQEAPDAVYQESDDTLYIKASARLLGANRYGSAAYHVLRELGRRYAALHNCRADFSDSKWEVTKYAANHDPKSVFAELFALSHLDQEGSWDTAIVGAFEAMMVSGGKDASTGLDPASLRDILQNLTKQKIKDFPVKLGKYRAKAGRNETWDAEAWIEYGFPKTIPIQRGKEPTLPSLQLVFKYNPAKGLSLTAYAKSPAMGIKRKIYENHKIAGNYERTLQTMLLGYQPEIAWK